MTEPDEARMTAEAAEWVVRLDFTDDEPAAKCRAELLEWLRRSPAHVRAFLCACVMFSLVDATSRPQ